MGRLLGYLVCGAVWDLCLCVKALLPLLGISEVLLGAAQGVHRCPGLESGWWGSAHLESDSWCGDTQMPGASSGWWDSVHLGTESWCGDTGARAESGWWDSRTWEGLTG